MRTERQIIVRAKQKVLSAASWYSQAELARLTGASAPDVESHLRAWKEAKMIFSVPHNKIELFPVYAFSDDKLRPFAGLQAVLMLFAEKKTTVGRLTGLRVQMVILVASALRIYCTLNQKMWCWQLRMSWPA
jgi:hypothetical protein